MSAEVWGSVAEWVTGLTTGVLAGFAYWTSRKAAKTAEDALSDARRQGASGLSWSLSSGGQHTREFSDVSTEYLAHGVGVPTVDVPEVELHRVVLVVRTLSANTYSGVTVQFVAANGFEPYLLEPYAGKIRPLGKLGPEGIDSFEFFGRYSPAVEANIAWEQAVAAGAFVNWVEFSTDDNRRWRRDTNGLLTEVTTDQALASTSSPLRAAARAARSRTSPTR